MLSRPEYQPFLIPHTPASTEILLVGKTDRVLWRARGLTNRNSSQASRQSDHTPGLASPRVIAIDQKKSCKQGCTVLSPPQIRDLVDVRGLEIAGCRVEG